MDRKLLEYITETAKIPSFSSFEHRLHSYVRSVAIKHKAKNIPVEGNSLIFKTGTSSGESKPVIALTAHLDKNNHYGRNWDTPLEVKQIDNQLEGPMDDSVGVGVCLRVMAEASVNKEWPPIYYLFSEMEESMGLREHPAWMRNNGSGLTHGMGARRISQKLIDLQVFPKTVITVDTTPLFKGKPGIALYARHWEYTKLEASDELLQLTEQSVDTFKQIEAGIHISNNTNDYLHYGYELNQQTASPVVSLALEPAIYPYHQKGERVYLEDIQHTFRILKSYLDLC